MTVIKMTAEIRYHAFHFLSVLSDNIYKRFEGFFMKNDRIYFVLMFLIAMIIGGTFIYSFIENWSLLDSLYMTVIVLTTIGFKEVHPLSDAGKIFTIIFSLIAFCMLAGVIGILSSTIIESNVLGVNRRKKVIKKTSRLKAHIIVCGVGKLGSHVVVGY
jgi:voltage-gated potassium channel